MRTTGFSKHDAAPNLEQKIKDKSHYYQVDVTAANTGIELISKEESAITDAGLMKKMRSIMAEQEDKDLSKKDYTKSQKELGKESKEIVQRAKSWLMLKSLI